jgi:hypothetical protein
MRKTTIYLPEPLKAALKRIAADEGTSEADVIRDALRREVQRRARPRPRLPIREAGLGDPSVAERVDELLEGFGR